jgi:hypothetical protein
MRIKAGNQLSADAGVIDFGSGSSLTEVSGHVVVAGLSGSSVVDVTTVAASSTAQTLTVPTTGDSAYDITLTANCTFTWTGTGATGKLQTVSLLLRQDGTGGRSATWPTTTWIGGIAPTLPSGASQVALVDLYTVDGGTTFIGVQKGIATGADSAQITTAEATSSATYTDLTTPGPTATVTVGPSGIVLVGFNTQISGANGFASVALSGANTLAGSDVYSLAGAAVTAGYTYLFTSLTAGSTAFKMRFRSSSGSITFTNRTIWALAL